MSEPKFVECRNCGTAHYVINKVEAENLKNKSINGFKNRSLVHCACCGAKGCFSPISEFYLNHYSASDKIPPIYLDDEKPKQATTKS